MSSLSVGIGVSCALGDGCDQRASANNTVRLGLKVVAFACALTSGAYAQCPEVLKAEDVQALGRGVARAEARGLYNSTRSVAEAAASFVAGMDDLLGHAGARSDPARRELRQLPVSALSACFPLLEPVLAHARDVARWAEAKAKAEQERQEAQRQRQVTVEAELKNEAWIAKAKDAIKDRLKDPRSAQFGRLAVSRTGGVPMVCGEVSSKNSFGGRNGFQRVVSAARPDLTFLEEEVEDMDSVWRKFC